MRKNNEKLNEKPRDKESYIGLSITELTEELRIKYETSLEEGISWIRDISESGARLFLNKNLKFLQIGEPLKIEINLP